MKNKETAKQDFVKMIKNSWTYNRMTQEEKDACLSCFTTMKVEKAMKGTYENRWSVLHALYEAYLKGIGYNGWNWRESNDD